MEYIIDKSVTKQIQMLNKRGGNFQRAAERVKQIIGGINLKEPNPFKDVPVTKNGETRIKHCIKYDLSGHVRLITIQDKNVCTLKFIGDHDDCHRWLETNKGLHLAIDSSSKVMVDVMISDDINHDDKRLIDESDYSEGVLLEKLKDSYRNILERSISYGYIKPFLEFDSTVSADELLAACLEIEEIDIQNLFFDVFSSLKKGEIDAAKNRVLQYNEEVKLLDSASSNEIGEIVSNDQYLKLSDIDSDIFEIILNKTDWYEWMVFLHPEQKTVVEADYNGPARLLGVSGSGKTCVLIHRAIRLAKIYPGENVLILTLNKSLSFLIKDLVAHLLEQMNCIHLLEQIKITSLWELSKELLQEFDEKENPLFDKIHNIITYKANESVDEIWQEFYKCEANNNDADVLFPTHQMLLARSIFPEEYIKQEFDWIRSALASSERTDYLKIEREGRFIPFQEDDRRLILEGLGLWEKKMEDIGVIDYLGFTNALMRHFDKITPRYRSILVDEIQDFGTLELKIVRKLVEENVNDIFICGDIAQQVYNRQHKIRSAGINILPDGFVKIVKNYRNSREILQAAYNVFHDNVDLNNFKNDEMEVLNPEYANFSSPLPFLRRSLSVQKEVNESIQYLKEILNLEKKEKACIAVCGYSIFEIATMFSETDLVVLDGNTTLENGTIFISDLEQTKGFEFDRVVIVNCSKDVFPSPNLPMEERFREISKLYVAMTRAKKELIISYSREYSDIFSNSIPYFTVDEWGDHLKLEEEKYLLSFKKSLVPTKMDLLQFSGRTFLYHRKAVGTSKELQNKLVELVNGKNVTDQRGKRIGWANMALLTADITSRTKDIPTLSRIFGPSVFKEIEQVLG